MLYDVIVTRPFDKVFTYSSINEQLKIGQVVLVPFGKSIITGVVWDHFETNNKKNYINLVGTLSSSNWNGKNNIEFVINDISVNNI